jgi:uncharacterized protein
MIYKVYLDRKLISSKCRLFDTVFSNFRGLMFRRLGSKNSVLLKSKREGRLTTAIHMFFVFYSLDIVWLDSRMNVVDVKRVRPFTPYVASKKSAKYVLEIKDSSGLKLGDKLRLVPFS